MGKYLIDRRESIQIFNSMLTGVSQNRILRIIGPEKMGKSRLMQEYRELAVTDHRAQCSHIDLTSSLSDPDDILEQITQQIGSAFFPKYKNKHDGIMNQVNISGITQILSRIKVNKGDSDFAIKQNRNILTRSFIDDLSLIPQNITKVFLFDAVDQASSLAQSWLNTVLIPSITTVNNTYIILAGRKIPDPLSTWSNTSSTHNLLRVDLTDHIQYCKTIGIILDKEKIQFMHELSEGRPGMFVELATKLLTQNKYV